MAWTSRGLRGSTLEEMINRTNEQYRDKHLALIQTTVSGHKYIGRQILKAVNH